jgi:GT2 family glycosyltransferase
MRLAFVVATKDRPDDLRKMLASLAGQSHLPDQVVIVDSSVPPVKTVAEEFPELNITFIGGAKPSASGQRNTGIGAADASMELAAFLDDDAVLEPGAIEAVLRFWETAPADLGGCAFNWMNAEPQAGARLKRNGLTEWLGLYSRRKGIVMPSGWATLTGRLTQNMYVDWLPSGASVWRRKVFDEFRFDEWFDGYSYLEDLDFSYSVRRKYRLAIVASAGFSHYPSPHGRTNQYRFGKVEVQNRLYLVRKHRLSVSRCYLGLCVRMLTSLASGLFTRHHRSQLWRWLGNCVAIPKSLATRPRRRRVRADLGPFGGDPTGDVRVGRGER